MPIERKATMVSARLPASLVARVDFIVNNTEGDIRSRSAAVQYALEHWLPGQEKALEQRLEQLGAPSKKVR
jgi:Arc/MetJ-type ribon-helix-helix transcriptional regulator